MKNKKEKLEAKASKYRRCLETSYAVVIFDLSSAVKSGVRSESLIACSALPCTKTLFITPALEL